MQINLHSTASSMAEGTMGNKGTTTQTGKNREVRTGTCEKYGHVTDKTGGSKHWKMADMLLIAGAARHLNLFPYWPHEVLMGDMEGKRDGGVTLSPVSLGWLPQSVLH